MRVFYSPQISVNKIDYVITGEVISATYKGVTDTFDFTDMPNGVIEVTKDNLTPIETELEVIPIIRVERVDGILSVMLVNTIDETETDEAVLFPTWKEV